MKNGPGGSGDGPPRHNFDTDGLLPEVPFDSVTKIQEVLDAGVTEQKVHLAFSVMPDQCLERAGELYRMNCDSAQANLTALATGFGATLVFDDEEMGRR